jgi:hypothetical protein
VTPAARLPLRLDRYPGPLEATTRCVRLGKDRIAYQVVGGGPIDLVITPGSFPSFDFAGEDPTGVHRCEQVPKQGQSWTMPGPRA